MAPVQFRVWLFLAVSAMGSTEDCFTHECLSLSWGRSQRYFHLRPSYNNTPTRTEAARISTCMELTDCQDCKSMVFDDTTKSCTWKSGHGNPHGSCCTENCTIESHLVPKSCAPCSEFSSCESCLNGGCRWDVTLGCVDDCSESAEGVGCRSQGSSWISGAFVPKSTKAVCDDLRKHGCEEQSSCETCVGYNFLGDDKVTECYWVWGRDFCASDNSWESTLYTRTCEPGLFATCEKCLEAGFLWETQTTPPSCQAECSSFACYERTSGKPVSRTCEKAASTAVCASQSNCASCLNAAIPGTNVTCVWSGSSPSSGTCCTDECRKSFDSFPQQISTCNYCALSLNCESCLDNQDMECLWMPGRRGCIFAGYWDYGDAYCFPGVGGSSNECSGFEESLMDSDLCKAQSDCDSCTSTVLSDGRTCRWYPKYGYPTGTCCTGVRCCNELDDETGYEHCAREECENISTCEDCLNTVPTATQPFWCKWSDGACGDECADGPAQCYESPPWRDFAVERCIEAGASAESPSAISVPYADPPDRPSSLMSTNPSTDLPAAHETSNPTAIPSAAKATKRPATSHPIMRDNGSAIATGTAAPPSQSSTGSDGGSSRPSPQEEDGTTVSTKRTGSPTRTTTSDGGNNDRSSGGPYFLSVSPSPLLSLTAATSRPTTTRTGDVSSSAASVCLHQRTFVLSSSMVLLGLVWLFL